MNQKTKEVVERFKFNGRTSNCKSPALAQIKR